MSLNNRHAINDDYSSIKKSSYREVRKFKYFAGNSFEELVEAMNKFIDCKNAKVVNYTIDRNSLKPSCLLLYSITIKSK